jgi:S1-C subfamily serine protease
MSSAYVWTCPQCGRSVPRRLADCRCGFHQDVVPEPPPAVAAPVPPVAPPAVETRRNNTVLIAAALVGVAIVASAGMVSLVWLKSRTTPVVALAPAGASQPEASTAPEAQPLAEFAEILKVADKAPAPPSIEELVTQSLPAVVKVETQDGSGSAFFVSKDLLVSNAHVVGRSTSVILRLRNGITRPATVERVNDVVDLAILKAQIVDHDQIFLSLGVPADVQVGNEVIAIGSPLGLQNTVTRGIVSGTRDVVDPYMNTRVSLIQTDAAINPGNSGGPLIDRRGHVIGVNTLKLGGRAEAIGFAVSIHYARPLLGPEFKVKSDDQQRRENAQRSYDDSIRRLAVFADNYEEKWKNFRSLCFAGEKLEEPPVHEWFVLAGGDQSLVKDAPICRSWKPVFYTVSKSVREGLAEFAKKAADAGVPPEKMLQIRRQYNMVYPAWE